MLRGAVFFAFLALTVYSTYYIMDRMDLQRHYHTHYPGKCRHVKGIRYGAEDIAVTKNGIAFVTTGVLLPGAPASVRKFFQDKNITGRISVFDFNNPDLGVTELKIIPTKHLDLDIFSPHGLDILEDKVHGEHLLYVVNHPINLDKDSVEKFRYDPKTSSLQHLQTIDGESVLTVANDLILVGEDKFYITNCFKFRNEFLAYFELAGRLEIADILFYNGTQFSAVQSSLASPNGITMSADGRFLYVNENVMKRLAVFERNIQDNTIQWRQYVDLHIQGDNVNPTMDGSALLVGGHTIATKIVYHLYNFDPDNNHIPSSVLRLPLKDGLVVTDKITELFYDQGDFLSFGTVAANYYKNLLIGSVTNSLVYCETILDI